jgi:hypothetical protein
VLIYVHDLYNSREDTHGSDVMPVQLVSGKVETSAAMKREHVQVRWPTALVKDDLFRLDPRQKTSYVPIEQIRSCPFKMPPTSRLPPPVAQAAGGGGGGGSGGGGGGEVPPVLCLPAGLLQAARALIIKDRHDLPSYAR